MSRAKNIRFRGEARGQGASRAMLEAAGDVVLDHREVPRALVMQCPDGCGEVLTVNLDKRSGKAWRLYGQGAQMSLFPSVWRDDGCKAHFILWKGSIIWCDRSNTIEWQDHELARKVNGVITAASPLVLNYVDIAQQLNAIPWEVLWACESLVRTGQVKRQSDSDFFKPKQ